MFMTVFSVHTPKESNPGSLQPAVNIDANIDAGSMVMNIADRWTKGRLNWVGHSRNSIVGPWVG